MRLVYIAGPFRGATPLDVRRNVEAARDLGLEVAKCGCYPVIPHTMTAEFDKQLDDQFWLAGTLQLMLRCHGVIMLPEWLRSQGAVLERKHALACELPVFYAADVLWRTQLIAWAEPEIV